MEGVANGNFVTDNVEIKNEVLDDESEIHIKQEVVDLDNSDEEALVLDSPVLPEMKVNQILDKYSECNCSVEELLMESDEERNFSKTLMIIKEGRPTPITAITYASQILRLFKRHYYEKVEWLTGCMALKKFYCWPCLIFDKLPGVWNKTGFDESSNFYKAYKRHEITPSHIVASMRLIAFLTNHCDSGRCDIDERYLTVRANREAMRRVVEVVCFVGGTRTVGINTALLLRLARREPSLLKSIPDLHIGVVKAVSSALTDSFKESITKCPFISIFLDETHEGHIATAFRCTDSKGELRDLFTGFVEGNDLSVALNSLYAQYELPPEKVIAILLGVTTRPETIPTKTSAVILHSPAHRMSRVVSYALYQIKECAAFFHVIQCFEVWLQDSNVEREIRARFPDSNVTKWREQPMTVLYEQRELIQDLALTILNKPTAWKAASYSSALVLQHAFKDLEFSFLLKAFSELLPVTDALLGMIISNSPDMIRCAETVDDYVLVLIWKKEKFNEIWDSIQEVDHEGPLSKKPRHSGNSKLSVYYRTLFETIIDVVVNQIQLRFKTLKTLEFVELIKFTNTEKFVVSEKHLGLLKYRNETFDNNRLRNELLVAYAQIDFRKLQCDYLLRHLFGTGLNEPLKQVTRLAQLCIMLPYATKTNYDSCSRLFNRITKFSKRVALEPDLIKWDFLTIENRLINKLVLTDSFLDKAIAHFSANFPNLELTLSEPETL